MLAEVRTITGELGRQQLEDGQLHAALVDLFEDGGYCSHRSVLVELDRGDGVALKRGQQVDQLSYAVEIVVELTPLDDPARKVAAHQRRDRKVAALDLQRPRRDIHLDVLVEVRQLLAAAGQRDDGIPDVLGILERLIHPDEVLALPASLVATTPPPVSACVRDVSRCCPSSRRSPGAVPSGGAVPSIAFAWKWISDPPVSSMSTTPSGWPTAIVTSSCRTRSSSQTYPRWKSGNCTCPDVVHLIKSDNGCCRVWNPTVGSSCANYTVDPARSTRGTSQRETRRRIRVATRRCHPRAGR